jgi:hypothetical protein
MARRSFGSVRLACPVLETDDVAAGWVDLAQADVDLLGDDCRGVVALESQPRDVGLWVIVPVDLHCREATGAIRA